MHEAETVLDLLTDLPHWEFEIVTTLLFDAVTLLIILPLYRKWRKHHKHDDIELNNLKKRIEVIESRV